MSVVECLMCGGEVTVPRDLSSAATVRCPLCQESYAYGDLQQTQPPALIVVDDPGAVATAARAPVAAAAGGFSFDGIASAVDETADDDNDIGGIQTSTLSPATEKSPARRRAPAPRRAKKKPKNPIFEVAKIAIGGVVGIVGALLILAWGPKIDALGLGPKLAKSSMTRWAVPASLRGEAATADQQLPQGSKGEPFNSGGFDSGSFQNDTLNELSRTTQTGDSKPKGPRRPRQGGLDTIVEDNGPTENGPTDNGPAGFDPFAGGLDTNDDPFGAPPVTPTLPTDNQPVPGLPGASLPDPSLPEASLPDPTLPAPSLPGGEASADPFGLPGTPLASNPSSFPDTGLGLTPEESTLPAVTPRPTALLNAKAAALEEVERTARDTAILEQAYFEASPTDRDLFMNFARQFVEAAARSGETMATVDLGKRELESHVHSLEGALDEIAKQDFHVKVLGALSQLWLGDEAWSDEPGRSSEGVLVAGVVKSVEPQDDFLKAVVVLRERKDEVFTATILLEKDPTRAVTPGTSLVGIGRRVADPKSGLDKYTGPDEEVLYTRMYGVSSDTPAGSSPEKESVTPDAGTPTGNEPTENEPTENEPIGNEPTEN
ncbi:hypothetical protein [Lignipirellula cremea]|uniref:Uncharacterized protein n=1 Tax=Lignipirellula cremea TaxID=2528010 RepID=A0A518DN28_9BACT|nr:hypothetical protein [Lignipirellula cremea]QDU93245.1 hypothetical protein Pla8534_10240 [Lignipirellula cremea]